MARIDDRLKELGIVLPEPPVPEASYVPFVRSGSTLYVSGQVSRDANGPIVGRLGDGLDVAAGTAAARTCGLYLIAQVRRACEGDLDRLVRVMKLTGFVRAAPDFVDPPKVVNGASDLLFEVFGDRARHARSAIGVAALPFGAAVEIEGVFEIA